MFNGPVNTKGFIYSPFQSLIKYNNPLHVCLPLPWPPAGQEEMYTAALYSDKKGTLAIGKRGLAIGTWMFSLLPSQFLAPRRAGLCTNLSDLNFRII